MPSISVKVNLNELAIDLVTDVSKEELIEFILAIDDQVCELDFTKALADKFQSIVDHEESLDG